MRKGGSGRGNGQPGSNGHDTFESDPDIGSDAGASGAGLTTRYKFFSNIFKMALLSSNDFLKCMLSQKGS